MACPASPSFTNCTQTTNDKSVFEGGDELISFCWLIFLG
jgi:hypothetical protein